MPVKTPNPPYYIAVFTSRLKENHEGYADMAARMLALASQQEGFLGYESARSEIGITVSYWRDLESIKKWGNHPEHLIAKKNGKENWYETHITRIAKVERAY
jgi:heme-degrading monooxygenase HmoA